MISEMHAAHNGRRIILDSKALTEKQVMTLLSNFFNYRADDVARAITRASISPWKPQDVGLHATVMATEYVARLRYRVSIIGHETNG